MRERYAQESADFSGAESSSEDENLSTIGTEIDKCKQELEQVGVSLQNLPQLSLPPSPLYLYGTIQ